ncbi:MAG: glycoside hydrolase family 13 protein [Oscillospiraceae bacterium]|nr:glycoside hydrolase family 13 protein [Oscillospiraceae bacterium]
MRILYDSKLLAHKDPFGTLIPGQKCKLSIHVPSTVQATQVVCLVQWEDGTPYGEYVLKCRSRKGPYELFTGNVTIKERGLYFYYFRVIQKNGSFRLFKQGDDTNMEEGDLWQVSVVPKDFTTPDWAKGAIIYQIFPDRFHKAGKVDLTGKLKPYTVHKDWNEEVEWEPDRWGRVLNNDFYGGNFKGIREKLDYIASLGTTIIYLNPISKAFSSHRYDTGDYKTPDPMLGTEEDFKALCDAAHEKGMKIILDGVYSHTGSDSLYFNKNRTFPGMGAYHSETSPYYDWYTFYDYPNSYNCWWNFDTLPTVNKMHPSFMNYIIDDEDSVVAHWLRLGADGFRLDVVDELPDEFVLRLKNRIRDIKPDALLIGEVWEDASNKSSYDTRRRYFVDGELDSPMNYPFRTAIINFMRKIDDGRGFKDTVMSIVENYPPQVMACTMNLLGTHDTSRILTAMIDDFQGDRYAKAHRRLTRTQWVTALDRLHAATVLQYTLPGAPSIYYGDEAGMEGYGDPFCRRPFPWGREERELQLHFKRLGQLRRQYKALRLGDIKFQYALNNQLSFTRTYGDQTIRIYVNRGSDDWEIPVGRILLARNMLTVADDQLVMGHNGFCIVEAV